MVIFTLTAALVAAAPALQAIEPPPALEPSHQYSVQVDGEAAFVFLATTDGTNVHQGSFVHIPLHPGATREVIVTLLERPDPESPSGLWPPAAAALRPEPVGESSALPTVQMIRGSGGLKWRFNVSIPLHSVMEFGAAAFHLESFSAGLMVFADMVDVAAPDPEHLPLGVTYFGPGVHELPLQPGWQTDKGTRGLQLQNHSTLYLADGAVVLGGIRAFNVMNVTIRGRGIIATAFLTTPSGSQDYCQYCTCGGNNGIEIENGTDIMIEGVTVMHATGWDIRLQSLRHVHVKNVKVIAWRCWNDGIDLVSSQDVLIEGVFIRSDDDSIAIKGMDPTMDSKNLVVRDSILWNQRYGNCMEIGFELFNAEIYNVTFVRNVCLHQSGSVMSIHNGGQANVHDVHYGDIVVQTLNSDPSLNMRGYHAKGCRGNGCLMLFDLSIVWGQYCRVGPPPKGDGCTDPSLRGEISKISMENIRVETNGVSFIYAQLGGNSSSHAVHGVTVTNLTIDGRVARSLHELNATTNAFVSGVTVQ